MSEKNLFSYHCFVGQMEYLVGWRGKGEGTYLLTYSMVQSPS